MAGSSDKNSYTLSEFVETFELPKSVRVTKGQEDRNKNPTIKEGQIFLFDCVSKVNCLSGVTSIGERKVCIPVDCEQRVEILSLVKNPATEGKYIRVVTEKLLPNKQVLKAGEILELLSVDDDRKLLTAIDIQGCIFCLPLSGSVGFHLLQSAGEKYLLADLIAKDLLPTYVRFVDPVSPEVRRTFIEEDHEHKLGAVYLERTICEQRGIEVTFDDTLDSWTRISWLPINIDITVARLHASDTEGEIPDTDNDIPLVGRIVEPPLPHPNDGECISTSRETELESISGKTEASPKGQLIDLLYEEMFDRTNCKQPLPHPNDGECVLTSPEKELKSISGKTEASPGGQLIDPLYEEMFDRTNCKQPLPHPNDGECVLTSETELKSISEKAETIPKGNANDHSETKRFLKQFASLPNLRNLRQSFTQTRNKETGGDRGTMPETPRRKSTDPLPVEPRISPKDGRLSDIPSDLTTLTKEDVSSLLENLNLGEYAARFYHDEVNGCRLVDLNVDTLVSSFGMGNFHALKLSMFVTGWRPRYSGSLHRAKISSPKV